MNENHSTNTSVIGLSGAVSLIVVSLLHYVVPAFMASMGAAGDIAVATMIGGLMGYYLPADFLQSKGGQ